METATLPALVPQVNGAALAVAQPNTTPLLMPVPVVAVVARHNAIQEIVSKVFQDGTHYGKIPGTGEKKTLLKPGFDTLCEAFQFAPDFVKQSESVETDKFIHLVYKCVLTSSSGRVVATGIGSCNSKEEKYRWITTARKCPRCGKEAIGKSKEEWGGGWYCNARKDGCGAKFNKGDRSIEDQEAGRKENDNAWNHHNTLTKMAQKRAGMAAIITACGISGDFTQDVEDFETPNNKAERAEPGVEIPAWQARAEADDRRMEDAGGADVYPWPGSDHPNAADAEFAPAAPAEPALPPDILKAREYILKELMHCTEKAHYQKLKAFMTSTGGAYLDPRVTIEVNNAYAKQFPAKPAAKAA